MTTPIESLGRLEGHAVELDGLSKTLARVQRALDGVDENGQELAEDGVEKQYQDAIDQFEITLYYQCNEGDGPKWPGEAMREKLARKTIPAELLGRRDGLVRKRERIKRRIGDLKAEIEAERSILSALKVEAEASGSGIRRAA